MTMIISIFVIIFAVIVLFDIKEKDTSCVNSERDSDNEEWLSREDELDIDKKNWEVVQKLWSGVKHNENAISIIDYKQWLPSLELKPKDNSIIYEEDYFEYYLDMNYLYRKGFAYYLNSEKKLHDFDLLLGKYNITNRDNDSTPDLIQKKYSESTFDNFYVRSFPYIENLTNSNIRLLKNRVEKNNYKIDDTVLKMIKETAANCYRYTSIGMMKMKKTGHLDLSSRELKPGEMEYRGGDETFFDKSGESIWIVFDGYFETDSIELMKLVGEFQTELEKMVGLKVIIYGGLYLSGNSVEG